MTEAPKLTEISVQGLLGRFNHTIKFPSDQEFVIVYGPNGIGKTRLLELVSNTFALKMGEVSRTPFTQALFSFNDGTRLTIENIAPSANDEHHEYEYTLRLLLEEAGGDTLEWVNTREQADLRDIPMSRWMRLIERYTPARYAGGGRFTDHETGRNLDRPEVLDRYGYLIPPELVPFPQFPEGIKDFLKSADVHLIETQRLLTSGRSQQDARGEKSSQVTVQKFSEDFSRRMHEALAQNSRTSQELDRTFPRRLLSAGHPPAAATEEAIRHRYDEQSQLRDRLAEISLLQGSSDLPLPNKKLDSSQRLVLWTYLDDSERKLATFEDLLRRVQLFRDIVNSRFQFKQLRLNRGGFSFVTDLGQEIAAESLSSGEQHELVLAYDLLFNVAENSLVLIDEPEISLHVAWQQEFLNDIAKIANTASLRFVVATHSPQIIHKWRSRAVSLGVDN
ncbi:AAA family ATPase [Streptomyces sp. MW-W600-10]|uniref:AAA family ATPase n=1 Tax=Streptomyces sp. MW-W600-10 TaxID=2829819 RepID=UPI001C45A307|nr:AAA family ATPase [Streptomyces sp. MW-W600-10]MBV7245682.1 AAA family ATPase [Streptomyces sp. MW-W600-10]